MNRIFLFCILFLGCVYASVIHAQNSKRILDSLAQRVVMLSANTSGTSVYLRTSKDIYETMEDVWFKAYAVEEQHQILSSRDSTLYVQLIHIASDSVVWEELYPIDKGIASGRVYLNNAFAEGAYWLCAYSANSFRTGKPYFVDGRKIEIVSGVKQLETQRAKKRLPESPDSTVHFQMFAEGGVLLAGVSNRIAFKAVSKNGPPATLSGKLYEDGTAIQSIQAIHNGMGSFYLRPEADKKYTVQLDKPFGDTIYPLPLIGKKGMSFTLLENTDDSLFLRIYNSGLPPQTFYLRMQTRGLPSVMASAEIRDSFLLKLPLTDAPAGISEITLFDRNLMPVAERLVYVKPNEVIQLVTELSAENAGKREKIRLRIRVTDQDNKPVIAQLGVVVYDGLYREPMSPKDIQTHYSLSGQIAGTIYNPTYYFDSNNKDRLEKMDLLLLTQGWRSYYWSEEGLSNRQQKDEQRLSNTMHGKLLPLKGAKGEQQAAVLLFDAEQKESRLVQLGSDQVIAISSENMRIGKDIYIKHFGKADSYTIQFPDPFETISAHKPWRKMQYPLASTPPQEEEKNGLFNITDRVAKLEEVIVSGKRGNVFRDKYIGSLDSIAKYQNNTDRTHGGWLNCPAGDGDERPVEGKTYIVWTGSNRPTSHPFSFNNTNTKKIVYSYPKYTEEELMRMFGISRAKGYYPRKIFYQPNYEKEQDAGPDYRNTLLWAPDVMTDHNGEALLEFYTSDINAVFYGIVEGISNAGALGKSVFKFRVQ